MTNKEKTAKLQIVCDPKLKQRVKAHSAINGMSMSEYVVKLLDKATKSTKVTMK